MPLMLPNFLGKIVAAAKFPSGPISCDTGRSLINYSISIVRTLSITTLHWAGAMLGAMKEFDPDRGNWTEYAERLKHYFTANNIEDATVKRSVLITVMHGRSMHAAYARLRRNVAPAKVDDKTFDELVQVMSDHCNPAPSVIMQRYKFNTRGRQPNESVMTYVSELRALAEHCKFPADFLDELLRDRLVCGINDQQIQRRLLARRDLKLQDAIDDAMSCENATKDFKALQLTPEDAAHPLLKVKMGRGQTPSPPVRCFRCNKTGHNAASCRFKSACALSPVPEKQDTSRQLVVRRSVQLKAE